MARLPRRVTRGVPESARHHVRLVTRLLVAQAAVAAAISLSFSRRSAPVVVTTVVFVAVLCALAVLASTGTHGARTVVLGVEFAVAVFGLYRFAFERYLGGTAFAIVITAVLMHPAVIRAYGGESTRGYSNGSMHGAEPGKLVCGDASGPGGGGAAAIADPAGGAFGEPGH